MVAVELFAEHVPATQNSEVDVGIAFDTRRRRIVMFFPGGIKFVDLYTGAVLDGGPLPAGVPSFKSSISFCLASFSPGNGPCVREFTGPGYF